MVCALCWFLQQFLCIKSQNCRQQNSPHSIPVNTVQGPLSESPCVAAASRHAPSQSLIDSPMNRHLSIRALHCSNPHTAWRGRLSAVSTEWGPLTMPIWLAVLNRGLVGVLIVVR